jgi:hypothetical protein
MNRKMRHSYRQPAFWQYQCCTHTLLVCCTVSTECFLSAELKDCCLCVGQGRLFGQVGFVCRLVCLPKVPDLQRWLIGECQPCTKTHVAVIMCPQGKVAIKNIIQSSIYSLSVFTINDALTLFEIGISSLISCTLKFPSW